MSNDQAAIPPAFTREVVYQLPYAGEIRRDIPYGDGARRFDLYYPEQGAGPHALVLFVLGFPAPGMDSGFGARLKQAPPYQSWARLMAARGMAAVLYSSEDAAADTLALIDYLKDHAGELNLDLQRLGLWSVSGNVPNAIHVINRVEPIRAAFLGYGFMLDLAGASGVRDSAAQFGFVNPNAGADSFPEAVPLLLVKAGREEFPGLNESIDNFVSEARRRRAEVELVTFASGVHAFDVLDESTESKEIVRGIVEFLAGKLLGGGVR